MVRAALTSISLGEKHDSASLVLVLSAAVLVLVLDVFYFGEDVELIRQLLAALALAAVFR